MVEIKIKLSKTGSVPEQHGDWYDLASDKTITYKEGEMILIPLGICVQLPPGFEAHILPRSSTFKHWGFLHASSGLIDEEYYGDEDWWFFCVYTTRDGEVSQGDRVCQFRIMKKQPKISFNFVETLGNKNRGGHGSTGK